MHNFVNDSSKQPRATATASASASTSGSAAVSSSWLLRLLVCVSCTSALLSARCSVLVALNYAEFNQLTLIGAPQSGECQVELTQSRQSCAGVVWPGNKSNLDDVYGAADDGESSTICPLCLAPPFSISLCLSLRCSLWAIRSVATRFAWLHSLLACGLAGKLIEIFLIAFFSLSLLWP